MATSDDKRRLSRLNKYPTLQEKPDDYLLILLEDARNHFLNFTHRSEDPGEAVDFIICQLAIVASNMEGVEGTTSAADGDISRTWDAVPPAIEKAMKSWRKVVGLNATPLN